MFYRKLLSIIFYRKLLSKHSFLENCYRKLFNRKQLSKSSLGKMTDKLCIENLLLKNLYYRFVTMVQLYFPQLQSNAIYMNLCHSHTQCFLFSSMYFHFFFFICFLLIFNILEEKKKLEYNCCRQQKDIFLFACPVTL